MRAALMVGQDEPLAISEVDFPRVPSDGVVVKLDACGVCRTDWHIWKGHWDWLGVHPRLPLILGHEMAGVVVEVGGEVRNLHVGDRVVAPFHYSCGLCSQCQAGFQNLCKRPQFPGSSLQGGFAEYVPVPRAEVNLLVLPDSVDSLAASTLGCRFMTAFHGTVEIAQLRPGERIAVYGCGGVGLSAVMIASALGAEVIAVDIDDVKLEKAHEVGASFSVNSSSEDPVSAIKEFTNGGVEVTIDALGIEETVQNSIGTLRLRGRHVQIGLTTAKERGLVAMPIDIIVAQEIRIAGCHGMPRRRYPDLLRMVDKGLIQPASLIGQEVSLENVNSVLDGMSSFENVGFSVITTW
ncbi:MAG: alcohol dehydrogenase catalytic domain-containing protein [Acidimicrobiia bacterium]|nr:alcohol dehydrogenase catalytic domain-containing protein [Acidimicrobiia bacterium]